MKTIWYNIAAFLLPKYTDQPLVTPIYIGILINLETPLHSIFHLMLCFISLLSRVPRVKRHGKRSQKTQKGEMKIAIYLVVYSAIQSTPAGWVGIDTWGTIYFCHNRLTYQLTAWISKDFDSLVTTLPISTSQHAAQNHSIGNPRTTLQSVTLLKLANRTC